MIKAGRYISAFFKRVINDNMTMPEMAILIVIIYAGVSVLIFINN